jgi:hypothetical protein
MAMRATIEVSAWEARGAKRPRTEVSIMAAPMRQRAEAVKADRTK